MTGASNGPVAAIDCGTNSTRLLIHDGEQALERRMRITRLGEGVDAAGMLTDAAIDRVVDCLGVFRDLLGAHDVSQVRMTATSAARDAGNSDKFFGAVEAALGERPELLTGDEEGRLAYAGAIANLDPADAPFLVIDIGGGSTELILGAAEPIVVVSLDIGSVRYTEKYLAHDPPRPEELSACITVTDTYLDEVVRANPIMRSAATFVGVAGTITTAAAVEIGLPKYDRDRIHHFVLTRAAAEDVFRTLATESIDERIENPGLEAERADIIVGGMCILVKIMRFFEIDELVVSCSDILDGLAASMLGSPAGPD